MATDYSILEAELKNLSIQLRRDLHMREVRKLVRKHQGLAKMAIQNRRIRILTQQISELEPTVSMIYSTQHALRDNQIKGYLVYLLKLKEYFARKVKTKKQIIREREDQIKSIVVRLCHVRNEYAKKMRSVTSKPDEFVKLEYMSNALNQIEKRVCTLQTENKKLRESILDLQKFLKRYRKFENEFRKQLSEMTSIARMHLENAVAIYEEKEELVNKTKAKQERCAQDIRKIAINQNALNLIQEKTKKYEHFEKLQDKERIDSRIAITDDLIEQGKTGLERIVEKEEDLYLSIAKASGLATPKEMEDHFQLTEDDTASLFLHLEDLLEKINHTQNIVDEIKEKNRNLLKGMTEFQRRLKWEIQENQAKIGLYTTDAEIAEVHRNEGRADLDSLLKHLWQLYEICCPDEFAFKDEIDDFNAEAVKESIEKKIIEYLMLTEYLKMKELPKEDEMVAIVEEEPATIEVSEEKYVLDITKPRILESETYLTALSDLEKTKAIVPLERLKITALAAIDEIELEDDLERNSVKSD